MSKRRDILTAIAFVLRKMDELSEEMNKPDAQFESLQERWHRLEMEYQALMDRLAEVPYEVKPPPFIKAATQSGPSKA